MNFIYLMLAFAVLCLVQNAVFTAVSRSRNSGDVRHHAKWAVASNGIWFVMQIFIMGTIWTSIQTGSYWQIILAAVVYTISTSTGSVWMMSRMLKTETGKQRVGARADENKPEEIIDEDGKWKTLVREGRIASAISAYIKNYNVTMDEAIYAIMAFQDHLKLQSEEAFK